ncbi:FtsX-like permease family protein [bacterium]|jgi:putative ABC transport system permease protein|nr:FtsX-like permease family protein [Candidatus Komeilibacteria bacterium]MBT7553652.1 FtsX-like permease family protein [bacterium]
MKLNNIFNIAVRALARSKIRTFLTVLGVLVGISSVTIIISAGNSVESLIFKQIEGFGSGYIQTEVRVPKGSGGSSAMIQGVVISTLKEKDRQDFLDLENIDKAYGAVITQDIISWQGEIKKTMIYGVGADYIDIDTTEIEYGRFYTEDDDDSMARVIVLGSELKEDLFGPSDAIGQNVKINKTSFKVIGVAKERGAVFTLNFDEMAYIPVKTVQKSLMGINYLQAITAQMVDTSIEDETGHEMRMILRENHDIDDPDKDDFEVMSATEAKEMMATILGGMTILLVVLAGLSLIVGGVGIMNIMYATVAERTFEIGLRKAVGASPQDILQQFLIESIIVTFLGGVSGIILGIIVIYGVYFGANYYGMDWPLSISWVGILLAIVFSVIVGLIFGLYPARKAAKLNPITALRKE